MADKGPWESAAKTTSSPSELLIADDDDRTRQLCAGPAGELNLTIRTANEPDLVLDALEAGLVDLLILSEQFIGSQEPELLRHIHYASHPLLVSGNTSHRGGRDADFCRLS